MKPSNILLQPDDETGEVPKIIDFGLAKTAGVATGAPLTRAGQIVGTPQYMAPEQIARKEVDARTDVYALGCVLYEMLCGRPPFTDNDDDVQLLYQQVHEPVEPVREHAPHVSAELEAVVMRALAKAPADRFQSARELATRARARRREAGAAPARRSEVDRGDRAAALAALARRGGRLLARGARRSSASTAGVLHRARTRRRAAC